MFEKTANAQSKLQAGIDALRAGLQTVAGDQRLKDEVKRDELRAVVQKVVPDLKAAREAEKAAIEADLQEVDRRVSAGYRRSGPPAATRDPLTTSPEQAWRHDLLHEVRIGNARERLGGAMPAELHRALDEAVANGDRATELVVRDLAAAAVKTHGANWQPPGGKVRPGDWPAVDWQDRRLGQHATQITDADLVRLISRLAEVEHSRFSPTEAEALAVVREGQEPRPMSLQPLRQLAEAALGGMLAAHEALGSLYEKPAPE